MEFQIKTILSDAFERIKTQCVDNESPEDLVLDYLYQRIDPNKARKPKDNLGVPLPKAGEGSLRLIVSEVNLVPFPVAPSYYPIFAFCLIENETAKVTIASKKDAMDEEDSTMLQMMKNSKINSTNN